jgi:alginate O-acetyltransferase complex protein AlgI
MAIGLGRIFGFHFPENFDYPYIAKSVTEFWRRWHISLGTWFHDYVYTPLGGSRVSKQRWVLNVFIICLLFGFWHGADWIFVIWGLYFAVLLLFEKLFYQKLLGKIPVFFSHAYLILIIVIGFVIFNANGMAEAIIDLKGMFGFFGLPFWNSQTAYYAESYGVLLLAAIIGATPFMKKAVEVLKKNTAFNRICSVFEPILHIILLFSVTSYLVDGSFKPFIYYKF